MCRLSDHISDHAIVIMSRSTTMLYYYNNYNVSIGRVKFLISPTYSYGGATATRARVIHLTLMEHGVLMVKVVMKSVVIISI